MRNVKYSKHAVKRHTDTKYTATVTIISILWWSVSTLPFMEAVKFIKPLKETFRASQKLT